MNMFAGFDVIIFENNVIFLIKQFFSTWPKSKDEKFKYLENEKSFDDEKKRFPSLLNSFHWTK